MRSLRSRRVSQRMNASRSGQALSVAVFRFGPGAATWVCPATGRWKFYVRGPGGWALNTVPSGGGSGGLAVVTRHVLAGEAVVLAIGRGALNTATDTTATFADGRVVRGGKGGQPAGGLVGQGGVAEGGDLNLAGSAGGQPGLGADGGAASPSVNGGAGAPGLDGLKGGDGPPTNPADTVAGVGAGGSLNNNNPCQAGGNGEIIIVRLD